MALSEGKTPVWGIRYPLSSCTVDQLATALAHTAADLESVLSNQLAAWIVGTNLFPDPRFLSGLTSSIAGGGGGTAGTMSIQTTGPSEAAAPGIASLAWKALRYQVTTAATSSPFALRYNGTGTAGLPVLGGATYTLSAWIRATVAVPARMEIDWYDAAGALISTSGASNATLPTNSFARYSHTATAPANAAFARVSGVFSNPQLVPVGGFFYITGILFERADTLRDFFDGSFADSSSYEYRWLGNTNGSASIKRHRVAP